MRRFWVIALAAAAAYAAALPRAGDIVRKSVANTMNDWNIAPQYDFTEHDVTNKHGRTDRTYRVLMIKGSPYNRLIAVNGEPIGRDAKAAQERQLRQEIARRDGESASQRYQRVAEYNRERLQDNALLKQMMQAIDFHVVGEDTVNGRRCFVLEGDPKPGYQPISRDTKVLKGMRGKMWIDEQQYQWVKVEAEVFRPVQFGLFIARVVPGTRFTLEQAPVGNLWLPSHFSMQVKARVLHVWSYGSNDDETYSDYRLAAQDPPARATRQ